MTGIYLWGMVLQYYGSLLSPNTVAELGTRGRHDERWEQKAITAGRAYGSQLQRTITQELKLRILQKRLEFSRKKQVYEIN